MKSKWKASTWEIICERNWRVRPGNRTEEKLRETKKLGFAIRVCGGERACSGGKSLGFFGARSDRIEATKKVTKKERERERERNLLEEGK